MMCIKNENNKSQNSWVTFCRLRFEYLQALAEIVKHGVRQQDTMHPAFCGCIDWHSSVHGTYALLAASRFTGESQWSDIVESTLTTERLEGELACLQRGELNHELPYGYAWFLRLAQERERWGRKPDLLSLATEIAQQLEGWIFTLSDKEIIHHTLRREYGNLSWAVLNLWEWSQWNGNTKLAEKLSTFTREQLLMLDCELPQSYDDNIDEFFAASLQRTRTILTVLDPEESRAWLASFYQRGLLHNPLNEAPRPHSAGLNFSRAWGLWSLFKVTGNGAYRDMYADHIVTHMESPQYWRDDYKKYSHWVPQFGIYAIALSMEGDGK